MHLLRQSTFSFLFIPGRASSSKSRQHVSDLLVWGTPPPYPLTRGRPAGPPLAGPGFSSCSGWVVAWEHHASGHVRESGQGKVEHHGVQLGIGGRITHNHRKAWAYSAVHIRIYIIYIYIYIESAQEDTSAIYGVNTGGYGFWL